MLPHPRPCPLPACAPRRLSASRHLVWNRNYNVKPREISTAQQRLGEALAELGVSAGASPTTHLPTRIALVALGRGGSGEVGQRIRDDILHIQQRNNCKGGGRDLLSVPSG